MCSIALQITTMKELYCFVVTIFLMTVVAIPQSGTHEKKERVHDAKLSGQEHYQNEQHNTQYDHEAFLGEDAKSFESLPPEESKRRLRFVFFLQFC